MNPSTLNRLRAEWAPSIPRELLAGAVATFALIPEVIAFSFVAGCSPVSGDCDGVGVGMSSMAQPRKSCRCDAGIATT